MTRGGKRDFVWAAFLTLTMLGPAAVHAPVPAGSRGISIGTVTTQGKLIVLTLDEGALGKANLFNLAHRTLLFTPEGGGYRMETVAPHWDPDFGGEMQGSEANLKNFAFPFSGKSWSTFSVGMTGSITFGPRVGAAPRPPSVVDARDTGGSLGRPLRPVAAGRPGADQRRRGHQRLLQASPDRYALSKGACRPHGHYVESHRSRLAAFRT